MITVPLPFGTGTIDVDVPDDSVIVRPARGAALGDPRGAVRDGFARPIGTASLHELVEMRMRRGAVGERFRVVVVIPDITRPMPHRMVLPVLLDELGRAGVEQQSIELLVATGTHRVATRSEMVELIGEDLVDGYDIHQHDANSPDHVVVGAVDGIDVFLDRRYVEADLRITTGFVEPHFFAGFSGGPKGVCPGLAAESTILEAHHPRRIADVGATWLHVEGNPVHDFVRAAVALDPPDLSVDVTTTVDGELSGVFCGVLPDAHRAACRFVADHAVVTVDGRFRVVVTTNGGHPLDRNLYQAVKGMDSAAQVIEPGGSIVMAAACGDGIPGGGAFDRILSAAEDANGLGVGEPGRDLWQAQVLGRVLGRAGVWMHTSGLSDDEIRRAHLHPAPDLGRAVREAVARAGAGPQRVCVIVDGPLSVVSAKV